MRLASLFLPNPSSRKTTPFSLSFRLFISSASPPLTPSFLCKRRSFAQPHQRRPPSPKQIPSQSSAHGMTWHDPYRWMANTDDPDLSDHLAQENSYAESFMADTTDLQRKLFSEMTDRMPERISSPPELWGHWFYYQNIPEGKEYPVLYRRSKAEEKSWVRTVLRYAKRELGKEEVLLDWNEIAEQYGYVHVGTCRVSPDHNFLAYTVDVSGGEEFVLQVKDLRTGRVVPNLQVGGVVSLAWARDSRTLFYTQSDDNQRPFRVMYLKLDSDDLDGVQVFTENDSCFCVDITSTKDGKFITVNSNSRASSEEGKRFLL